MKTAGTAASGTRRYDSQEYLDDFKRTGAFPPINRAFVNFVAAYCNADRVCSLGSGLGLDGQEIHDRLGKYVVGVEKIPRYNAAARAAGVTIPLIDFRVLHSTFAEFAVLMREHRIEALVCRRNVDMWHEIGDESAQKGKAAAGILQADGWHMTEFAELCRDIGIKEILLQGDSRPSKWELEFEVSLFVPIYRQRVYEPPNRAYLTVV